MSEYSKSLSSTWQFAGNLANCRPAVDLDVSDDYLLFDNQVEVTYTQETRALGCDGKINVTGQTVLHICHARLYQINFRDLLSEAAGHLKVGDVRAELSVKELDGLTPKTGDRLDDYNVFAVDYDFTAQMHIVWCRK